MRYQMLQRVHPEIDGLSTVGIRRGFLGHDFEWPMIRLADGFEGNSDEYTTLWEVYESSYAEGTRLRSLIDQGYTVRSSSDDVDRLCNEGKVSA